ncbi:GDSL lipase/esterase [Trypanosoma melophagium]|uniref:GDSL lipase/esterase n=1 Tax=Trypanosoma melophagium TaxID=715481 RepID=UPI00351A6E2F|nr:GDSL lipase/esterase [Trypanosoma melophagium]
MRSWRSIFRSAQRLTVTMCLLLPVLLSGSVEAAKSPPFLCILPVGDSITQGIQKLGSFRSHLNDLLVTHANKTYALIAGHEFMGFESGHCWASKRTARTINKYRANERDSETLNRVSSFTMPHQGHCGWTSTQVLQGLENIFNGTAATPQDRAWQKHYRDTFQSCQEKAAEAGKRRGVKLSVLVVATLFVGHNDVFYSASRCTTTQYKKKGNGENQECIERVMELYRKNIHRILEVLNAEYVGRQKLPLLVLFGLNTPTNYLPYDELLHSHIQAEVKAWQRHPSDGKCVPHQTRSVVRPVSFDGFGNEMTVDTTHPDIRGSSLLGNSWMTSLLACLRADLRDASDGSVDDVGIDPGSRTIAGLFFVTLSVAVLVCMMRRRKSSRPRD